MIRNINNSLIRLRKTTRQDKSIFEAYYMKNDASDDMKFSDKSRLVNKPGYKLKYAHNLLFLRIIKIIQGPLKCQTKIKMPYLKLMNNLY